MRHTRRDFIKSASAFATTSLMLGQATHGGETPRSSNKVGAFVKPFPEMPYDRLAETMARLGFDGIEAAVRDGGQVKPERVEEDLPKLVEALKRNGLEILVMTCGVKNLKQPHAEKVLRTAAQQGIKLYRLAYYQYESNRPIPQQLAEFKRQLDELAAFNRELGITAVYQNHSGTSIFGAPIWDLYTAIKDIPVSEIGMALDIGHATVEGGQSWPVQCSLMRPHLRAVYVKDFVWRGRDVQWVPLGEGRVDPRYFASLRQSKFTGPISLHIEYLDDKDAQRTEKYLAAFERDIKTLKTWLSS